MKLEEFIENEKAGLAEMLAGMGHDVQDVRDQAAKLVDLSAQVLAYRMAGADTTIAEQSIFAIRKNLEASLGVSVAGTVRQQVRDILVRTASFVAKAILAL